jgi:hypothetical protein
VEEKDKVREVVVGLAKSVLVEAEEMEVSGLIGGLIMVGLL